MCYIIKEKLTSIVNCGCVSFYRLKQQKTMNEKKKKKLNTNLSVNQLQSRNKNRMRMRLFLLKYPSNKSNRISNLRNA